MTANAFRLAFNRARAKVGVPHFHFHDTRHERISSLFEANWSMIQVMAQTGHRDPKSVKRYAHLTGDFLADQLAKLEQRRPVERPCRRVVWVIRANTDARLPGPPFGMIRI
jgi:integrase